MAPGAWLSRSDPEFLLSKLLASLRQTWVTAEARLRTLGAIFLSAVLSFPFVSSWVSRFLLGCLHFGAMWEVCYTTPPLCRHWIIQQYPVILWFWQTLYKIRHVYWLLIFARKNKVQLPTYFFYIFCRALKGGLETWNGSFLGSEFLPPVFILWFRLVVWAPASSSVILAFCCAFRWKQKKPQRHEKTIRNCGGGLFFCNLVGRL